MENDNRKSSGEQSEALSEHEIRVSKLTQMRTQKFEPWPYAEPVNATCQYVKDEFKEDLPKLYDIAGRILTIRLHGKTGFCTIQDSSGRLQVYIRKDMVGDDAFDHFKKHVDIGDIVWFSGKSFKTKTGEITLKVQKLKLLSKCLHPLPEKFHGIADIEIKYRQRYLDLISNSKSKEKFIKRSKIVSQMRAFFDEHGYLEVETPMLHPIPGGAAARPFVTHHNTLDSEFYLRVAPELYLKRLVIGGFERVYEINRNFRNEGISTRHNPEFTMLEFYTAHKDYIFAMDFLEKMLKDLVKSTSDSMVVKFGKHEIDFSKSFDRLSMQQAVMKYGNYTAKELSDEHIDDLLAEHHITLDNKNATWGYKLAALFEEIVENKLVQPTFITDFPVEISPLAKRKEDDPRVTARFELFIAGMEIANGFNELNDPFDQAKRFKAQAEAKAAGDAEAHHYDQDYILALEHGLPPTVGVGVGIDRLTMLLTDTVSIKDVILFPTLKKKEA